MPWDLPSAQVIESLLLVLLDLRQSEISLLTPQNVLEPPFCAGHRVAAADPAGFAAGFCAKAVQGPQ
eukprot:1138859-Pelagomonas_calceolata.AAC.2